MIRTYQMFRCFALSMRDNDNTQSRKHNQM